MAVQLFRRVIKNHRLPAEKTEIDKAIIAFKVAPPTALIKKCREFLSEYHNCTLGAIPDDEAGLIRYITEKFDTERAVLQGRIAKRIRFLRISRKKCC